MKKIALLVVALAALVVIASKPINSGSGPGSARAVVGLAAAGLGAAIGLFTNSRSGRVAANSGLLGGAVLIGAAFVNA